MPHPSVLVLDLGTSSCKAALYSPTGDRLALSSHPYPISNPQPDWSEQNPADYLAAAHAAIDTHFHPAIQAISFSTQTPTLVFLDDAAQALGPAILWQDSRAAAQAAQLNAIPTRRDWFGLDLPIGAAALPPKLLWVAQNDPARWHATRWVVQPKDFVSRHLTGNLIADRWCAKGIAHLETGLMHPAWLALLNKQESICPPIQSIRAIAGHFRGIPVLNGWSDAMCAILATGAMHIPNRAFILTGTSEIIGLSRFASHAAQGLFHVPPLALELPALSLHYGPTQAGGSTLEWIAKILGRTVDQTAALVTDPSLSDIRFRPYLQGERAPFWDHTLTAAFENLRAHHTASDLVKAVMQGVAEHERLVLSTAAAADSISDVILAGGATRNPLWNQIRARVLNRPLRVMPDPEASLRGAAMLAWSALDPSLPLEPWYSGALLDVLP